MKTITARLRNEILNVNKRISHRPFEERLSFINSYLNLKLTESDLRSILQ